MKWNELSEVAFGLILEGRHPATLYKPEYFTTPYDSAVEVLQKKGATKEDVSKVISSAYLADASEAVHKFNGIGEYQNYDWSKALIQAYQNHERGKKFEKLGRNMQNNEPVDVLPLYAELGSSIANETSGLQLLKDVSSDYKPFKKCGYEPLDATLGGIPADGPIIILMPTGHGKCFGKGTLIMMYDGTSKFVEDIKIGDKVMGPDSRPRNVVSLGHGYSDMYKVIPSKGNPYIVNDEHILSLKLTKGTKRASKFNDGDIVNISVKDYLSSTKTFRHAAKGWRTGIDFKKSILLVEPRFLGLWLGDGNTDGVGITSADDEIVSYLREYANRLNSSVSITAEKNGCARYSISNSTDIGFSLQGLLRDINVLGNKHIPLDYLFTNREDRLLLLAGLLDSDGSLRDNGYDYISKLYSLAEDVVWLARSLGFASYMKKCTKTCANNGKSGIYYRVSINGNVDEIPVLVERKKAHKRLQKKDVLVTGISVEPIGYGEYFGFEVTGDGLFLLDDFTVTHNSTVSTAVINGLLHQYKEETAAIYTLEMNEKHWRWRAMNMFPSLKDVQDRLFISGAVRDIDELVAEVTAKKVDYVVLDDMDNIVRSQDSSEYERVYRRVKEMCRFMGIPVFVLAQPNRQAKWAIDNGERFPSLYDSAWSGASENSAALFLAGVQANGLDMKSEQFPTSDSKLNYLIAWKSRDGWPADYDPKAFRGPGAIIMEHSPDWLGKPYGGKWKLWSPDSSAKKIAKESSRKETFKSAAKKGKS